MITDWVLDLELVFFVASGRFDQDVVIQYVSRWSPGWWSNFWWGPHWFPRSVQLSPAKKEKKSLSRVSMVGYLQALAKTWRLLKWIFKRIYHQISYCAIVISGMKKIIHTKLKCETLLASYRMWDKDPICWTMALKHRFSSHLVLKQEVGTIERK